MWHVCDDTREFIVPCRENPYRNVSRVETHPRVSIVHSYAHLFNVHETRSNLGTFRHVRGLDSLMTLATHYNNYIFSYLKFESCMSEANKRDGQLGIKLKLFSNFTCQKYANKLLPLKLGRCVAIRSVFVIGYELNYNHRDTFLS